MIMKFLDKSFIEMQTEIENMPESEKDQIRRELEGIALRAAEMAAYIDYRQSHGASDQGHKKALKNLNRVGKLVWVKGFGYNARHDCSF